jgi:hypothetical protein
MLTLYAKNVVDNIPANVLREIKKESRCELCRTGNKVVEPIGRCAYVAPYCGEESSSPAGSRIAA